LKRGDIEETEEKYCQSNSETWQIIKFVDEIHSGVFNAVLEGSFIFFIAVVTAFVLIRQNCILSSELELLEQSVKFEQKPIVSITLVFCQIISDDVMHSYPEIQ
jgi:hypothetical protein